MYGVALLAIILLLLLCLPISIIVLFVKFSGLKERVRQLEANALATAAPLDASLLSPAPKRNPSPWPEAVAVSGDFAAATREQTNLPPAKPQDDAAPAPAPIGAVFPPIADQPTVLGRFFQWIISNWVYAISAASLALAGIFLVQFGIENGVFPPVFRVLSALFFGMILIGAGEWIRRRFGDEGGMSTVQLPSVFSGAGIVSMFGAILSARQIYGLIGPETTFIGLFCISTLALVLGWFYGPLLIAVGLIGAAAGPFLVSGDTQPGPMLYAYFALIAGVGLGVDALRHWRWVSVLALVAAFVGATLVMWTGAGQPGWIAFLTLMPMIAIMVPNLWLVPKHAGPATLEAFLPTVVPSVASFTSKLAFATTLLVSVLLSFCALGSSTEAMLAITALAFLAIAVLIWADRAPGLADLSLPLIIGFLASLVVVAVGHAPLARDFAASAILLRAAETAPSLIVSLLLLAGTLISGAAILRALRSGERFKVGFGLVGLTFAPIAAVVLELFWAPAVVLGPYAWALHVIALACGATALALVFAKLDQKDMRLTAYATLSALSLIALALFLLMTASALTLALAVLALVAAGLDRRFKLAEMGYFIQLSVAVIGYRLLVDPGWSWAEAAPTGTVILVFGGTIGALIAAWIQIKPLNRSMAAGVLESAIAGFCAVFVNIMLSHWLSLSSAQSLVQTHWSATLYAMPWLILALIQAYRTHLGGVLMPLRVGIAVVAGGLACTGLLVAMGPSNPLFSYFVEDTAQWVRGPWIFDSLAVAYAIPGVILVSAAIYMQSQLEKIRLPVAGFGGALLVLYVGLEIRRLWQGDWLGGLGVVQGELYTYTVAMMIFGGGLLCVSILRRGLMLRRLAMLVIGLTIAKVFFLDASGLSGLTRVVSFLGLGLSLAGLAWLNRWAGEVSSK